MKTMLVFQVLSCVVRILDSGYFTISKLKQEKTICIETTNLISLDNVHLPYVTSISNFLDLKNLPFLPIFGDFNWALYITITALKILSAGVELANRYTTFSNTLSNLAELPKWEIDFRSFCLEYVKKFRPKKETLVARQTINISLKAAIRILKSEIS